MVTLLLLALTAGSIPVELRDCPRDLVGFLRYTVERRAAEGLNRVVRDPADPKHGTVYGGRAEDANIAWVAGAAYRYPWSRLHRDPAVKEAAELLLDTLCALPSEHWDDNGHGTPFGIHSLAWAVLTWVETGDIEPERAARWRAGVAALADDAILVAHHRILVADYANPEFYYLAGLAAAWRLTGEQRYRDEAGRALRWYDEEQVFAGGGVAYFLDSGPVHNYQQMVVKATALYWDLTGDELALQRLRQFAPYFVDVLHPSGLISSAEHPWLKQSLYQPLNPAVPAMIAAVTSDAGNRWAADVAAQRRAENVDELRPSFFADNPYWYNYSHTTFAVTCLRLLERYELPEPLAPETRRLGLDGGFRGVRSHWDRLTAATTTRPLADTLAGAYLASDAEPMWPLDAAVDGVYFRVYQGDRSEAASASDRQRADFRQVEMEPAWYLTTAPGLAASSVLSRLCSPHWSDRPWLPGERWRLNEASDWSTIQHWAVWRGHLIGLGMLLCHADGGDPTRGDRAEVSWRLAPDNRQLAAGEPADGKWAVGYGGLRLDLELLAERGGFVFGTNETNAPPHLAWAPAVTRPAPWRTGDQVQVGCDIRAADADGEVTFGLLNEAAAALLMEPDRRQAVLWVGSLCRHWRWHQLAALPGVTVRVFRGNDEMPRLPADHGTILALQGGQNGAWLLTSEEPMEATRILGALSSGYGRGERFPDWRTAR